jgi:multidrug efflux pump subunit AcrB
MQVFFQSMLQRNKSTLLILSVFLVIMLALLSRAPIQLLPHIEQNRLIITTWLKGADAQEIEQTVTLQQELVLRRIKGVREFSSTSEAGKSTITVTLQSDANIDLTSATIANTLNTALPRSANLVGPTIAQPPRQAAAWYFLTGYELQAKNNPARFDQLTRSLATTLKSTRGIEDVRLVGKTDAQVKINIKPQRLAYAGVSVTELENKLQEAIGKSVAHRNISGRKYRIKANDEGVINRIRAITLKKNNGQPLKLTDVASIEVVPKEGELHIYSLGKPAVAFRIQVDKKANIIESINALDAKVSYLNDTLLATKNMRLDKSFDASTYLYTALGNVLASFALGLFLCSLLVFAISRSLAQTLALVITIIASMVMTLGLVYLCGGAFNLVTFAGITLSVGMALDNAIIVYDNLLGCEPDKRRNNQAVIEIVPALFGSTLTSLIVLVPVFLIEGYISALFRDLALALGASLLSSFVVSLTLLPVLLKNTRFTASAPKLSSSSRLIGLMTPLKMAFRLRVVMVITAVAVIAVSTVLLVPKTDFLPNAKWEQVNVLFRIPNAYSLDYVEENLGKLIRSRVDKAFEGDERVKNYYLMLTPSFGQLGIRMHQIDDAQAVIDKVKAQIFPDGYPVAPIIRRSAIFSSFSDSDALGLVLSHTEVDQLVAAQGLLKTALEEGIEGVRVSEVNSFKANMPTIELTIDDARLARMAIEKDDIMAYVKALSASKYVGQGFVDGEILDISLSFDQWQYAQQIPYLSIASGEGTVSQLGNFVKLTEYGDIASYAHVNGIRSAKLNVFLPESMTVEAGLDQINQIMRQVQSQTDAVIGLSPEIQDSLLAKQQLIMALLIATVLVFTLFVVMYESFILSLLIMATAPVAILGGFIALWVSEQAGFASGDLLSLFAYLVLIGVSVNNGLLLIQKIQSMKPDKDNLTTIVRQAMADRMRPILLTTFTSVLGMLPFVFGGVGTQMFKGLALVVIGGLLLSVLATSFLVTNLIIIFANRFLSIKEEKNYAPLANSL